MKCAGNDQPVGFTATFLFLAQKARSVVNRQTLPGWLYTVAYRTAVAARTKLGRRRQREQQVEQMPHPEVNTPRVEDWQVLLDEELNRLPDKYRVPIILCDLEGRTRKEVCRQLRLAEGTLSSRLNTAKRKLAERLTRRGLTLSAGALGTALSESASSAAALPPGLAGSTARTAALVAAGRLTAVSSSVLILMKMGAKAMFVAKLKATVATVVVLAFVGGGIVYSGGAGQAQPKNELEALRRENELLKVNLRVTLEKIEAFEKQVASLKAETSKATSQHLAEWVNVAKQRALAAELARSYEAKERIGLATHARQMKDAFQALSKLRAKQENKEARQQAIDALEKALKSLHDMEPKVDFTSPPKR